ncbi:MAG TPA: hypothetical protein VK747_03465 [Blastocatellia bacterium]|nr:hypothetical protein [Blastocatellia bacterium]
MILIIGLGVLTTVLGVAFGCTVLELTMRALERSLNENTTRRIPLRQGLLHDGRLVR